MNLREEIIGNARLILGDCREVLPTLGRVDAVVTDPPYGMRFESGTRSTKENDKYARGHYGTEFAAIRGDDAPFDPEPWIRQPAILWGANNYAARLPDSNGWLCWYKAGGITGFRMSECELAWTNVLSSTRYIDHLWHGFKRATQPGEKVNHPTEKPVAIMRWCLDFVPYCETILDPFMGSGTTGVACAKLGRSFIGIEIEEKYFSIACRRIEDAYKQADLFIEPPPKPEQLNLAEVG